MKVVHLPKCKEWKSIEYRLREIGLSDTVFDEDFPQRLQRAIEQFNTHCAENALVDAEMPLAGVLVPGKIVWFNKVIRKSVAEWKKAEWHDADFWRVYMRQHRAKKKAELEIAAQSR